MLTGAMLAASVTVIVVTLVLVVKEKRRVRSIHDHIAALEAQKQQYERKNTELKERIAYLQSERAYETEAKKINYQNPDEQVAIVRRSREDATSVEKRDETSVADVAVPPRKHHEIWCEYFFR